jgi:hypothetical protein
VEKQPATGKPDQNAVSKHPKLPVAIRFDLVKAPVFVFGDVFFLKM